ncbi:ZP3 protein, partial [Amazona guildingii]|nr:ZP3 protein [Amazona guildingii]
TTAPWPWGLWLVPGPSPCPWTVTTPGKGADGQGVPCPWGGVPGAHHPPWDALWRRTGSVSSGAIRPTWVPFGSTVAHRRPLRFALDAYDSTWASRLLQPLYPMGELMNIEASVSAGPILPMRVFVDECEAAPGAGMQPRSRVIDNG